MEKVPSSALVVGLICEAVIESRKGNVVVMDVTMSLGEVFEPPLPTPLCIDSLPELVPDVVVKMLKEIVVVVPRSFSMVYDNEVLRAEVMIRAVELDAEEEVTLPDVELALVGVDPDVVEVVA